MYTVSYRRLLDNKNWVFIQSKCEQISRRQYKVDRVVKIKSSALIDMNDLVNNERGKTIKGAKIMDRHMEENCWNNIRGFNVFKV